MLALIRKQIKLEHELKYNLWATFSTASIRIFSNYAEKCKKNTGKALIFCVGDSPVNDSVPSL